MGRSELEMSSAQAKEWRDHLLAEMADCRYVKDRRALWRVALEYNQIAKGTAKVIGDVTSPPASAEPMTRLRARKW